jgi:hypothetical protein
VLLLPFSYQALRALGQSYALPLAMLTSLGAAISIGALRLYGEMRLAQSLSIRGRKAVQAAASLCGLILLFGALWLANPGAEAQPLLDLAQTLPAELLAFLGAYALLLPSLGSSVFALGAAGVLLALTVGILGSVRAIDAGARGAVAADSRRGRRGLQGSWERSRVDGLLGPDWTRLKRDPGFLTQTVLVPSLALLFQLGLRQLGSSPSAKTAALLAYGACAYAALPGCMQILTSEGRALWLLFTLPIAPQRWMQRKIRIWTSAAMAVGVAFTALGGLNDADGRSVSSILGLCTLVAIGLLCATHMVAAIAVLGASVNSEQAVGPPKARHAYLILFLLSLFSLALAGEQLPQQVATTLVFMTLAYALWQRAVERLPYLLDPIEEPPAGVTLLDGASALLTFLCLQLLAAFVLVQWDALDGLSAPSLVTLAFAVAGCATLLLHGWHLSGRGVELRQALALTPERLSDQTRALALGLLAGLGVGLLAVGYLHQAIERGWIDKEQQQANLDLASVLLAVVLAPAIEEPLFRGLVLGGMLRTLSRPFAALASAAIFAALHPPHAWLPVLALGLVTAAVRIRSGWLAPALCAHALYNVLVLGAQVLLFG